jgi:hypothetical protein
MTASGRRLARVLGVNDALLWGLMARVVTLVAAPVTLYLVTVRRPASEQGLYFVFVNAQAVVPLFELGVGSMMVQFASHLQTASRQTLLRAARPWYLRAAWIIALLLMGTGVLLFRGAEPNVLPWLVPWVVLSLAVALYVLLTPVVCVAEGSGELTRVQRLRTIQAVLAAVTLWMVMPAFGGPMAVTAATLVQCGILLGWLGRAHSDLLRAYLRPGVVGNVSANDDAPPRVAGPLGRATVQWLSGFVVPQLLAPLVFAVRGSIEAGRVGLSFAVATVPLTLATAWLYSQLPSYGALAAASNWRALDRLAFGTSVRAVAVATVGVAGVLVLVAVLGHVAPAVGARFLPLSAVAALGMASIAGVAAQAMSGYLRADRDEPLAVVSTTSAVVGVLSCALAARLGGGSAAAWAYAVVTVFTIPVSAALVWRHRARRHALARTA